jgi:hypothetical protein
VDALATPRKIQAFATLLSRDLPWEFSMPVDECHLAGRIAGAGSA